MLLVLRDDYYYDGKTRMMSVVGDHDCAMGALEVPLHFDFFRYLIGKKFDFGMKNL
jgi:hypothetical protein